MDFGEKKAMVSIEHRDARHGECPVNIRCFEAFNGASFFEQNTVHSYFLPI
jgi:hypothetical protein